jgi:hypothetical protein
MRYLIHSIANRIRWTDEVGWFNDKSIGVILPETSAVGAGKFAECLCDKVASKCPRPEYTIYMYPSLSPNDNGHSSQLNFADIYPQCETKISQDNP